MRMCIGSVFVRCHCANIYIQLQVLSHRRFRPYYNPNANLILTKFFNQMQTKGRGAAVILSSAAVPP